MEYDAKRVLLNLITKLDTDSITKIYHGKNNWCRCGCGGSYFYKGDRGYTMAVNKLKSASFDIGDYENIDIGSNYINIPEGTKENNKCYCIYFD